ncbi:hypothetical protein Q8G35_10915 [Peribacillus simplex]|uniref:Uncharacterized protein n=2 Tax=Peribacillus TaxID=2675229 RepID=A0AA90T6K3_9BACI|nr:MULTISPECIES: hypothetical protein [Peribacillus]MDP1418924.1 hypothetical protein [Peribacillus simplex]MDP1451617.1 hypothetical protein [Peribacillus frigoritolerans]
MESLTNGVRIQLLDEYGIFVFYLELNEKFTAGMVDVCPPGTKHGPWKLPNGCKVFEVQYYTK